MASLIFSSRRLVRRLLSSLSCSSSLSAASLLGPSSPLPPAGVSAAACPRRSRSGDSPMESRRPISRVVFFSSQPPHDLTEGPAAIDYGSLLTEDEFHRLADTTINDLQEKFEEFGDDIQIDGFDIDYGNQVLTLKIGELGTYVINKQTPNRQIWLSSPVSGPSRFDWDGTSQAWIYRRTKAKLLQLLEDEFVQLCGKSINLS